MLLKKVCKAEGALAVVRATGDVHVRGELSREIGRGYTIQTGDYSTDERRQN